LKLWKDLLAFGGYGFNKAHSDAYSVMTMQCAYLATYYPMEWYAAVLTKGKSGVLQQYVGDIQRAGIKILPVDINASKGAHVIEGDTIRLALSSVKGVGVAAIQKIVAAQPYTDFIDFLDRSGASKTAIVPLLRAGAFDTICAKPMAELENKYEQYAEVAKLKTKKGRPEFVALWDSPWDKTEVSVFQLDDKAKKKDRERITLALENGDYPIHTKVDFENQLFGFSLRGSPFEILERDKKINDLFGGEDKVTDYTWFITSQEELAVIPVTPRRIFEKAQRNGQLMAFLTFESPDGTEFDCPCFSTVWKHVKPLLRRGKVYLGTFNRKLEDPTNLMVGKPGFGHSAKSAAGYMIDVDEYVPGATAS
jgi:DNA polymerase III alpha subunit